MFNLFKRHEKIREKEQEFTGFAGTMSLFYQYFWCLVTANLLFLLMCIPIITIPASVAGLCAVTKKISQGGITYTAREFFKVFRRDFKLATLYGWLSILGYGIIGTGIYFYNSLLSTYWWGLFPMGISILLALCLIVSNMYGYLLITSVDLGFMSMVKNSVLLALVGIKKTGLVLLLWTVLFVVYFLLAPLSLLLLLFFAFSLNSFIASVNCYGVVEKFVINPYYEKDQSQPM